MEDLFALLLLFLPAIFKLVKENNKKNQRKQKLPTYDEGNAPNCLSRLGNEVDNLFGSEDDADDNGQEKHDIYNIEPEKLYKHRKIINKTNENSKVLNSDNIQPMIDNKKVNINSKIVDDRENEIYDGLGSMDFSSDELIKSIIMSEILNKPVSKRGAR